MKAAFNLTSAHCFNPSDDFFVNLYTDWSAYESDGSDGYCYDAQGLNFDYTNGFISLVLLQNSATKQGFQCFLALAV